jgi:copper homeostasis protein
MPKISFEACACSINSAIAAQKGGAARVELCENLKEGGTTPSFGLIMMARKLLQIKLYVLIRPRGGDFLYNELEFEVIKADIRYCIEAGCDGIVIGILNADGTVDKKRCTELIQMAKQWGLGATFHRAFDMCADQNKALEDIIDMGFERILTSGGRSTAMEGAHNIAGLIKSANGRISIMPGSGVSEANVADLVKYTGAKEIHASARTTYPSKMTFHNDHILMGASFTDEYSIDETDADRVRSIIRMANEH